MNIKIKNTLGSAGSDMCMVTFENSSKMMLMLLKSMKGIYSIWESDSNDIEGAVNDEEFELYTKWIPKLKEVLIDKGVSEEDADKIARDNAEYFISAFSPSTAFKIEAPISIWNKINATLIMLSDFMLSEESDKMIPIAKEVCSRLCLYIGDFCEEFKRSTIYCSDAEPYDDFMFIPQVYPNIPHPIYEAETYHDVYSSLYYVSLDTLCKLQDYRSIRYKINDARVMNETFYCPDFIGDNEELKKEWGTDMESIKNNLPQGLAVEVVEIGGIDDFLSKCKNVLCGGTEYELQQNVSSVLLNFYNNKHLSPYWAHKVEKWLIKDEEGNVVGIKTNENVE